MEGRLDQHYQDCLIISAIEDTEFLEAMRYEISPEDLTSRVASDCFRVILDYYDKHEESPKEHFLQALKEHQKKTHVSEEGEYKYNVYLDKIYKIGEISKSFIISGVKEYIDRNNRMKFAEKYADLLVRDRLNEADELLQQHSEKSYERKKPVRIRAVDYFDEAIEYWGDDSKGYMMTGIEKLDRKIGGIKGLVNMIAEFKIGKTTIALNIASHLLTCGIKVFYLNLENNISEILGRVTRILDCKINNKSEKLSNYDLYLLCSTEGGKEFTEKVREFYKDYLYLLHPQDVPNLGMLKHIIQNEQGEDKKAFLIVDSLQKGAPIYNPSRDMIMSNEGFITALEQMCTENEELSILAISELSMESIKSNSGKALGKWSSRIPYSGNITMTMKFQREKGENDIDARNRGIIDFQIPYGREVKSSDTGRIGYYKIAEDRFILKEVDLTSNPRAGY